MSERTLISVSNDPVLSRTKQTTVSATTTFTAADAGAGTYNVATDAIVMNLPIITADTIGMEFTFRNTGADGAVLLSIDPNAVDGINGSIANAAADSVASGVVGKKLNNTKATANNGDYVTLKAVALTKWFIVGGVGIWASEA
jgi:hypothetical protein